MVPMKDIVINVPMGPVRTVSLRYFGLIKKHTPTKVNASSIRKRHPMRLKYSGC